MSIKNFFPSEILKKNERKEVQSHGFSWEKELITNVYHATIEEIKQIKYNSKIDLPSKFNHIDNCDISIKTSGNKNSVCMSDCLRLFDSVEDKCIHLVVVHYKQINNIKKILSIIEIDLTNSRELLFGNLNRAQIEELDKAVKSVPQKKKPTDEQYNKMYILRDSLISGNLRLDIKCNSTQSRLQCSFNHFQKFIENNPKRIIAKSNTNEFRGGIISSEILSSCRTFN